MSNDLDTRYSAHLTAGALLLPESRRIASLMITGVEGEAWHNAIYEENVLQKRSRSSITRTVGLIRNRLLLIKKDLWPLVADEDRELACQVLLIATIKHSRILGDFMQDVLHGAMMTFKQTLTRQDWESFLSGCDQRSPEVASWTAKTRRKLGNAVLRCLAESGYLENTRTLRLQPVTIRPQVRKYLIDNDEEFVLQCMDMTK